jgi:hypothetical protein
VDDTAKKVIIIFPTQKTYAESPLPLDMKNLTDEESWNRLQNYQTRGKVETTDQHRRIGRWDCRAFKVTVDVPTPLEITYWATEDLPFDWRKAAALALPIRKLANYSEEYIEALSLIQGHPVLIETTIFISGSSFGSVSKVAEISESSAPDDIFAIPEGFEKKERLSILDLRIR